MIIPKKQQEAMVSKYVKEGHTQDECVGFIDGLDRVVSLIEELSQPSVTTHNDYIGVLKSLIGKDIEVNLLSGHKAMIIDYAPETFLVRYNHNEHTDWIEPLGIKYKK